MRKTPVVMSPAIQTAIIKRYRAAQHRLVFLDYDGTLWPTGLPEPSRQASAEHTLVRRLIRQLTKVKHTTVIIVSGRDHTLLAERFKGLDCALAAEHGLWLKEAKQRSWLMVEQIDPAWITPARIHFQQAVRALPRSWFEEKPYSLVWHYRAIPRIQSKPEAQTLLKHLYQLVQHYPLRIIHGRALIELLPANINKGRAAQHWLKRQRSSLIIAAGDDRTDEDLFAVLPREAITIKIQTEPSVARYLLPDDRALRDFLVQLADRKSR